MIGLPSYGFKNILSIIADIPWAVIGSLLGLVALVVIMAVVIIVVKCYSAKAPVDEPMALQVT